jgi:murein DD-endopeptidase MepM/ murein hydrolase activator NlpD
MPAAARARRRRRWLAAGLIGLTAPILAISSGPSAAFATTDAQRLAQLQQESSSAATDIGVRDAAADKAAVALAQIAVKIGTANKKLVAANQALHTASVLLGKRRGVLAEAQTVEVAAQAQADAATVRYNSASDQIRLMLRAAFEGGVGGDLDALMSGGSPDTIADRMGLLDELSKTRQQRLISLGTTRDEVTHKQQILTAARKKAQSAVAAADQQVDAVGAAQSQAQAVKTQLVSLQTQQKAAVAKANAAASLARQQYSELQASSDRLQEVLAARAGSQRYVSAIPLSSGDAADESAAGLVMPTTGVFSSGFGYRVDPFGGGTTFHAGQDIAAPTGTPIVAATGGTVAIVETPAQSGGYGNYTCIDRGAGFATCYAHQSAVFVHVGQVVAQSQLIGLVGSTGASTGPHLHFEVRINGVPVNPVPFLP